jgi:two-component system chemotaxis response regulator CheB
MAEDPIPVVVFSATTGAADAAMRALADGAVDVVTKPRVGLRNFVEDGCTALVETVRGAASARVRRRVFPSPPWQMQRPVAARNVPPVRGTHQLIAIGASTGGTEALATVLRELPADAPGVAVVQHMPEGFTAAFAARLDAACTVEVKEARPGDRLTRGRVLIAPGNRHLVVRRSGEHYVADVLDAAPVSRHRPSVDVLFGSVAEAAGAAAMGVILTGMGSDGATGLLEMKRRGAHTLAQAEASCVVFGMPKEAIARGAAVEVLPLERMAAAMLRGREPRCVSVPSPAR